MRRHGRLELLLVLPDGSKRLIPAEWTSQHADGGAGHDGSGAGTLGPYGKGPANCGNLAVRPTQPTPRLPGPARSGAQTVRFGVASASHLGDQVTGRQGGFRAKGQARYVTVRDRSRLLFTPLSRLPGSGRPRHEPASCQWICQWET
jgi:hypothetical protein